MIENSTYELTAEELRYLGSEVVDAVLNNGNPYGNLEAVATEVANSAVMQQILRNAMNQAWENCADEATSEYGSRLAPDSPYSTPTV